MVQITNIKSLHMHIFKLTDYHFYETLVTVQPRRDMRGVTESVREVRRQWPCLVTDRHVQGSGLLLSC
jgi:hypothetical protein